MIIKKANTQEFLHCAYIYIPTCSVATQTYVMWQQENMRDFACTSTDLQQFLMFVNSCIMSTFRSYTVGKQMIFSEIFTEKKIRQKNITDSWWLQQFSNIKAFFCLFILLIFKAYYKNLTSENVCRILWPVKGIFINKLSKVVRISLKSLN
jgi:hypothetical protein